MRVRLRFALAVAVLLTASISAQDQHTIDARRANVAAARARFKAYGAQAEVEKLDSAAKDARSTLMALHDATKLNHSYDELERAVADILAKLSAAKLAAEMRSSDRAGEAKALQQSATLTEGD